MIQIELLKEELTQNKNIHLYSFSTFPGISETYLEAVEKKLKISLSPALKEFYKITNGWQVRWAKIDNEYRSAFEKEIKNSGYVFAWDWPAQHYWQIDGIINILPIEKVFFRDYKDFIWFDFEEDIQTEWNKEQINLLKFKQNIRPFDVFDKYYTVAIYIGDKDLPLLLGNDHNATFQDFKPISFDDYFNHLIIDKGEVAKRVNLFKY